MFKMNLDQQQYITDNSDMVEELASKIWDLVNEIDYEPTHPNFEDLKGSIANSYISAASYLILVNNGIE